jgi:Leucine-rich repeat (LRR) protein
MNLFMKSIAKMTFFIFLNCLVWASVISAQVQSQDSLALVALYDSTNGDSWSNNSGWKNGPVSTWHGVGITGDRVTSIILPYNNLTGKLPSELGDLSELMILYLNNNAIGDTLPEHLGSLTNLESLYIMRNNFTGGIPDSIGNLSSLQEFYADYNNFNDTIPHQIGNLSSLRELKLNNNNVSGTIPPSLGDLSSLTILDLNANALSGSIPPELGRLGSLYTLDLSSNQLTGSIPDSLENLYSVTTLDLSDNQLIGVIPSTLGNFSTIVELVLSNNQLTGPIPSTLGNVNIQTLYLNGNQLTGNIPSEIGNITNLQGLFLHDNQLTGPIPANLYNLNNLIYLNLSNNQLSDTISADLATMASLGQCYLNNNYFTGAIPAELGNAVQILRLWLNNNQLEGTIPAEIADNYRVNELYLQNNLISGMEDMSSGNFYHSLEFKVEDNLLDFDDLEPNANLVLDFTYAPQALIGQSQNELVYAGDSVLFGVNAGGTTSQYHWFKDSIEFYVSSDTFIALQNVQIQDAGDYYCSVTNTTVSDLTLYSHLFTLSVIDTIVPAMPQDLSAVSGDQEISLIWRANEDPDSIYYRIYMDTIPQPAIAIDSTDSINDTTRTLSGLINKVTYYIRITAVDWSGNESEFSNEVQAVPAHIDSIPPAVPQNLTGVAGDSSVILTWNSVVDTGYIYYRVYMDTVANPLTVIDSTTNSADTSRTITSLANNQLYHFRVTAIDKFKNESDFSNEIQVLPFPMEINEYLLEMPENYCLIQNYPNPFNPSTIIEFDLPKTSQVSLKIFNVLGEELTTLVSDKLSVGSHKYRWSAGNLASGVYLYRLEADGFVQTRKMILMK